MGLKIDHRTVGGLTVVSLAGDIDVFESPRLREELQRLIEAGHQHLAVDLNAVRFLDSTGLGVLVGIFHRLRAVDGSIVLICTSDRIREVFRVTRLTDVFAIHPDLESVMRARQVE
jgi:anti-sigma B factor antagonist